MSDYSTHDERVEEVLWEIKGVLERIADALEPQQPEASAEPMVITNAQAHSPRDGKQHPLSCAIHNGVSECSCSGRQ